MILYLKSYQYMYAEGNYSQRCGNTRLSTCIGVLAMPVTVDLIMNVLLTTHIPFSWYCTSTIIPRKIHKVLLLTLYHCSTRKPNVLSHRKTVKLWLHIRQSYVLNFIFRNKNLTCALLQGIWAYS